MEWSYQNHHTQQALSIRDFSLTVNGVSGPAEWECEQPATYILPPSNAETGGLQEVKCTFSFMATGEDDSYILHVRSTGGDDLITFRGIYRDN